MDLGGLAIAKASFKAALMRPGLTTLNREEIACFEEHLDMVMRSCSRESIQFCKTWLIHHVVHSDTRSVKLGRYLTALSGSLGLTGESEHYWDNLHLLYLIHDLHHHIQYHQAGLEIETSLNEQLQWVIRAAISSIAIKESQISSQLYKETYNLIEMWQARRYWDDEFVTELHKVLTSGRTLVEQPSKSRDSTTEVQQRGSRALPILHGEVSSAYHELPAANFLAVFTERKGNSTNSQAVTASEVSYGASDQSISQDITRLLRELESDGEVTNDEAFGLIADIDDLGQSSMHNFLGEIAESEAYYGWSKQLCRNIKRRQETIETSPHTQK